MIRKISSLFLIFMGQILIGIVQYIVIMDKRLWILIFSVIGSLAGIAIIFLGFKIYEGKRKNNEISHKG
ncbi:hypothetical protein ACX92S_13645 (plasmid) [Enterococcus faecalis]